MITDHFKAKALSEILDNHSISKKIIMNKHVISIDDRAHLLNNGSAQNSLQELS